MINSREMQEVIDNCALSDNELFDYINTYLIEELNNAVDNNFSIDDLIESLESED